MNIDNLYNLTPLEFQQLVAELLSESGFNDVKIVDGANDRGVDILCVKEGKEYAVQVKHKKNLNLSEVSRFLDRYCSDQTVPRTLIYATSAEIPNTIERVVNDICSDFTIKFIGRQDILKMLAQQRSTATRFYTAAMKRLKSEKTHFIIGVVLSVISAVGVNFSTSVFIHKEKAPLNQRIESVEKTLTSIRDLEAQLNKVKEDMIETEKATKVINEKHAKAKELEKLTEVQLETLRNTLQTESWRHTIINYALGFLLGIASSFLASVLYAKWQQRKALS